MSSDTTLSGAIQPPSFYQSVYGVKPRQERAASMPGLVSLGVRKLFPDITPAIYNDGDDVAVVRRAAEAALASVDMSKIKPQDTVNVVSCEHGFSMMGGRPYAEMLKAIRDVLVERTGCKKIRLRVGAWQGFREADEVIDHFGLGDYYGKNNVKGFGPWDKGVPIETEAGTFYGIKKVYDAKWFIHAYYDDAREIYLHRYLHRTLKAFVMAFARLETRGLYHNYPTRCGNFLPKAIFESDYVQDRYTFSCILRTSPDGVTGIDAGNDIYEIDRRITRDHLRDYGKMQGLFTEIDECVAVVDGGRWVYYLPGGGLCFCELLYAQRDNLDLSNPITTAGWDLPDPNFATTLNPAIKMIVVNQAWRGIPFTGIAMVIPTILVGQDLVEMFSIDPGSPGLVNLCASTNTLDGAVSFAQRTTKTDKLILFDGSFGHINLSPSLARFMLNQAPKVSAEVDAAIPTWLKQRGIDPAAL